MALHSPNTEPTAENSEKATINSVVNRDQIEQNIYVLLRRFRGYADITGETSRVSGLARLGNALNEARSAHLPSLDIIPDEAQGIGAGVSDYISAFRNAGGALGIEIQAAMNNLSAAFDGDVDSQLRALAGKAADAWQTKRHEIKGSYWYGFGSALGNFIVTFNFEKARNAWNAARIEGEVLAVYDSIIEATKSPLLASSVTNIDPETSQLVINQTPPFLPLDASQQSVLSTYHADRSARTSEREDERRGNPGYYNGTQVVMAAATGYAVHRLNKNGVAVARAAGTAVENTAEKVRRIRDVATRVRGNLSQPLSFFGRAARTGKGLLHIGKAGTGLAFSLGLVAIDQFSDADSTTAQTTHDELSGLVVANEDIQSFQELVLTTATDNPELFEQMIALCEDSELKFAMESAKRLVDLQNRLERESQYRGKPLEEHGEYWQLATQQTVFTGQVEKMFANWAGLILLEEQAEFARQLKQNGTATFEMDQHIGSVLSTMLAEDVSALQRKAVEHNPELAARHTEEDVAAAIAGANGTGEQPAAQRIAFRGATVSAPLAYADVERTGMPPVQMLPTGSAPAATVRIT